MGTSFDCRLLSNVVAETSVFTSKPCVLAAPGGATQLTSRTLTTLSSSSISHSQPVFDAERIWKDYIFGSSYNEIPFGGETGEGVFFVSPNICLEFTDVPAGKSVILDLGTITSDYDVILEPCAASSYRAVGKLASGISFDVTIAILPTELYRLFISSTEGARFVAQPVTNYANGTNYDADAVPLNAWVRLSNQSRLHVGTTSTSGAFFVKTTDSYDEFGTWAMQPKPSFSTLIRMSTKSWYKMYTAPYTGSLYQWTCSLVARTRSIPFGALSSFDATSAIAKVHPHPVINLCNTSFSKIQLRLPGITDSNTGREVYSQGFGVTWHSLRYFFVTDDEQLNVTVGSRSLVLNRNDVLEVGITRDPNQYLVYVSTPVVRSMSRAPSLPMECSVYECTSIADNNRMKVSSTQTSFINLGVWSSRARKTFYITSDASQTVFLRAIVNGVPYVATCLSSPKATRVIFDTNASEKIRCTALA